MKTVTFAAKRPAATTVGTIDDWVSRGGSKKQEPTKRFTIDVPVSLHKRVKSQCALQNLVMADVMRDLLAQRFPAEADSAGKGGREYDES